MSSVLLMGALAACDARPPDVPSVPQVKLLAWDGDYPALFDDGIELPALGVSLDGQPASADPQLPAQVRASELVTRVTVATLSRDGNGEHSRYILSVRVEPNALVSRHFVVDTLDLTIQDSNPSYELVSSYENTVRGRTFIAFLRRFQGPEGPVVHWHLTADAPDVVQAVQVASTLASLQEE